MPKSTAPSKVLSRDAQNLRDHSMKAMRSFKVIVKSSNGPMDCTNSAYSTHRRRNHRSALQPGLITMPDPSWISGTTVIFKRSCICSSRICVSCGMSIPRESYGSRGQIPIACAEERLCDVHLLEDTHSFAVAVHCGGVFDL